MTPAGSSAGPLPLIARAKENHSITFLHSGRSRPQSLEIHMCLAAPGAFVSAAALLLSCCAKHSACAKETHFDVYAGSQKATYNKQESRGAIAVMLCIPLSGVSASPAASLPSHCAERSAGAPGTLPCARAALALLLVSAPASDASEAPSLWACSCTAAQPAQVRGNLKP